MHSNQTIKTTLAIAFMLAAMGAPAASANNVQSGRVAQPNPDQQATQLARPVLAGPACSACEYGPLVDFARVHAAAGVPAQTSSVVRPNPDQQTPASAPVTIVRVSTPTSGFDWGDAGIGAASGFALSMLALGLALVVSQHRARRTNRPAATAR